jgi:hypothetical protein
MVFNSPLLLAKYPWGEWVILSVSIGHRPLDGSTREMAPQMPVRLLGGFGCPECRVGMVSRVCWPGRAPGPGPREGSCQ